MAENAATASVAKVASAQAYIKEKYSDTIGLATSILGQVLLGTIKGSKRRKEVIKLCLKDMKHQFSDRVAEDPLMEIEFMKTICNRSHPNFVRFIDAVEDHKLYCMCIEYVSGGDMCTYIQNLRSGIDNERAKKYAIQLTKAVYFMHSNGYCHLDLSLENVLWDKKQDTLKICDFGLARKFPNGDKDERFIAATIRPGKKGYMAPEIYAYQRFNGEKADVFSLGVIIFILLTGFPPFTTPNASDKCFQYMYYGKLEWLLKQWKLNDIINEDCRALLSKIFCHPKKRIGIKEILESKWLDQNIEDIDKEMISYTINIEDTLNNEGNTDKKEESPPSSSSSIERNEIDRTDNMDEGIIRRHNKKRKSVTRLVKKKRLSKKKKKKRDQTQTKVSNNRERYNRVRGKSKSIAHINMAHVLLNESSTSLLSDKYAATVSTTNIKGGNGDDAGKSRRTRSKSLSYSHHHHHSSYSFINDLKNKRTKANKSMNKHNVQIRRDSVCSASSSSGREIEETNVNKRKHNKPQHDDHKQRTANLRDAKEMEILNDTQLITQKYNKSAPNTVNEDDYDHYFDNDRKEGDDETYPYDHHQHHERNDNVAHTEHNEERRLSIASQDAGNVHSQSQETNKASSSSSNNNNSKSKDHPPV